ncbi:MAG: glycosyltransferase [Eubacteriaceae bacterium]|nr:glycosyltransferase [Eubacteriaceae bacterium]
MKSKVSIIIPVYNTEKYISKCIDSIMGQAFTDFDLILVNDGSTDNSGKICNNYASEDDRISVIHKPNGGQSSARNAGLAIAKGEYISFIDSDDWIDPDFYCTLVEYADSNRADIAACNLYVVNQWDQIRPFTPDAKSKIYSRAEAVEEIFSNRILTFSPCNKIYRRHIFENLRFDQDIILEDMDIAYKIIHRANKIVYLEQPLYYYRYNNESTLRKKFTLKRIDEYEVKKRMYEFYLKNYPELADQVYLELLLTGINLYRLVSIHHRNKLQQYQYLIEFDRKILRRLLTNSRLKIKKKIEGCWILISPKISIWILNSKDRIRKLVYLIKAIKKTKAKIWK